MANWATVENNEVTGRYDVLPRNWRNISGLDLSANDLPFLKSLGWYPVTKQEISYDDVNYFINDNEYKFENDQVLEIPILTAKEIVVVDAVLQKQQFMETLRNERNKKLIDSDWTQLDDVQNSFDEETKNKWIVYRQALRDITEVYFNNDITDINQVRWPLLEPV